MKSSVAVAAMIVGALAWANDGIADDERYSTDWAFETRYESGHRTLSSDPNLSGRILMPTGSPWSCKRSPMSLNGRGVLVAGYFCTHGEVGVAVSAACGASQESTDSKGAMLADANPAGGNLWLAAACKTSRRGASRPAISTDRNL